MKNIKLSLLFLLAFLSYGCNSILVKLLWMRLEMMHSGQTRY